MAGIGWDGLQGPSQHKPFLDSVVCRYMLQEGWWDGSAWLVCGFGSGLLSSFSHLQEGPGSRSSASGIHNKQDRDASDLSWCIFGAFTILDFLHPLGRMGDHLIDPWWTCHQVLEPVSSSTLHRDCESTLSFVCCPRNTCVSEAWHDHTSACSCLPPISGAWFVYNMILFEKNLCHFRMVKMWSHNILCLIPFPITVSTSLTFMLSWALSWGFWELLSDFKSFGIWLLICTKLFCVTAGVMLWSSVHTLHLLIQNFTLSGSFFITSSFVTSQPLSRPLGMIWPVCSCQKCTDSYFRPPARCQ